MSDGKPFLGVPGGPPLKVENPDGVFLGERHSLYDSGSLPQPVIPGDYDLCRDVPRSAE
jgi:hypothetical protein